MKRYALGLFVVALVGLSACSSGTPTRSIDGKLSAHSQPVSVDRRTTTTVRHHHRGSSTSMPTATTRVHHHTSSTEPSTTPTTPTTMSQTGVAGAVIYARNCSSNQNCSFEPGPAQVALL